MCDNQFLRAILKGKGGSEEERRMITEELGTNIGEAEMNVEQEVLKDRGEHQLKAHENPFRYSPTPPLQDKLSPVLNSEEDEKEEEGEEPGKLTLETSESREHGEVFGKSTVETSEILEEGATASEQVEVVEVVVVSPMEEQSLAAPPPHTTPRVALPAGAEDSSTVHDSPDSSGLPSVSNAPTQDDDEGLPPPPHATVKKRAKKGRMWKKSGGRKKQEKEVDEFPVAEVSYCRDAGTQTDQQELERNIHDRDVGRNAASELAQHTDETALKSNFEEQHPIRDDLHEISSDPPTSAAGGLKEEDVVEAAVVVVEEDYDVTFQNLKALRSFGRWADVSEDTDTSKANEMEQLEGSPSGESRAETTGDHHKSGEDELRSKASEQGVEGGLQGEDSRAGTRSNHDEEQEISGKYQQAVEAAKSRDVRTDNWNSRKEQELRGKSQLGLSQASREMNWRQRPVMESRVRQDSPRKLGVDGEIKKDEEFRSGRTQYSAEPQATHKNWIPRRGIQRVVESEGRAEQNKARGKGKQGREAAGPQPTLHHTKDFAKQKFDADTKIKQEELLLKSRQSLKAEFLNNKRVEQTRKGGDELEMELNKNLVYLEGDLFYLNP